MRKLLLVFVFLAAWLVFTLRAEAQPPLPPEQWTDESKLWLSRAFVAEAGWLHVLDHTLIAWALTYNWRRQVRRHPELTFVDIIRDYCSALDEKNNPTRRQTWVRNLPPIGLDDPPLMWPSMYSWPKHLSYWRDVQAFVERWGTGAVRDPSRGRVRHWGSPSPELPDIEKAERAKKAGRWVQLVTPGTTNIFYGHGSAR